MNIKKFVISDLHFGHNNILEYEPCRKVLGSTVAEMNEEIIKRWNETVNPEDIVYVLGDFSFRRENIHIAGRLNGTKYLVMGNHDQYDNAATYLQYFTNVYGSLEMKKHGKRIIMTHIPISDKQFSRFDFNLHGHLHSKKMDDSRYVNCCIEHCPNFKPMLLDQLIQSL